MVLPDLSKLHLNGLSNGQAPWVKGAVPPATIPDDILNDNGDRYMQKLKDYAQSLPYSIEPYSRMLEMLDFIILRIVQCVEAKDYEVGLVQWDSMLNYHLQFTDAAASWTTLEYPIPKDRRIYLAKLYYQLSLVPGMPTQVVAVCADGFKLLTKSKNKISIEDMRLPWKPIDKILRQDLFLSRRQFEYTQTSWCMGYIADNARRFFHPAAINEMLSTFLPLIDGTKLDYYLPMIMRLWESINSYMYDERLLHFLAKLAEMHVDPTVSDPRRLDSIPDDERSEDEGRPNWQKESLPEGAKWNGVYKDVGIFTERQWSHIMCKCLGSMDLILGVEIPLADGGSLTTGPTADSQVGFEIGRLPKPQWRIPSLARIIVYSMAQDGPMVPPSNFPTPMFSPLPTSGINTPQIQNSTLGDYLSAPLNKKPNPLQTYLGGSRALDSLARLIASTESFFHPSNSGSWTGDLTAFIKYVVYEFNKRWSTCTSSFIRWHEEQKPDCKTPKHRRLTKLMKRELVKSLRTVTLLAMFSQDSTTVSNVQSCLKSMSVLEPDLILEPILERAVPSLEALVETQRTIAVIKALCAVAPAIVSREVYYPGAKHLVPLLQLLIPGIDLNDPSKTLCTTAFISEIAQYIQIGDLTAFDDQGSSSSSDDDSYDGPPSARPGLPTLSLDDVNSGLGEVILDKSEEDALLKETTRSFPDWVTSFIRRVILLLENLPEEGPSGTAGGATEVQLVDSVTSACSQICVHLSEPLFDLVLGMVFDYASNNVRSNAVRAIHQLVECVANANPVKTLALFFPFCEQNIRTELENGASSLRTTSSSAPLPSDATLHWNLAILRGTVYNDGKAILPYKDRLLSILCLLHEKTFSKRGYSWTGKLISSLMLTLTHTYPLENKFINPSEASSSEFKRKHHLYWGKLYRPDEITIAWHVPSEEEIDFALEIFRKLVEPTLVLLEGLLRPGIVRDAIWRNDFCRHLTLVRNAFSGIPTLFKEHISAEDAKYTTMTTDILNEIPEMIASVDPLNSGFSLTDPDDPRYQYIVGVKKRFGDFLHRASTSLRSQGEENTVDAVQILVRSIRTYMMEYGDSRDSYYLNEEQYTSEKNVARQYAGQKVWPRAIYVRRARFYNAARLRWNSIERKRGPIEDKLIDDIVEWSLWHYSSVRQSSQSVLESLCSVYDGVRRRALPILQNALDPGNDDDRMKGALWTINLPSFGKYAITGLNSFVEPCNLVYNVSCAKVEDAMAKLRTIVKVEEDDRLVVKKCEAQRVLRVKTIDDAMKELTSTIIEIGESEETHWKYLIFATRCLRTLVRRDVPVSPEHFEFFLYAAHDDHPNVPSDLANYDSQRYYAQRAIMKIARAIKLRTYCADDVDLALAKARNPLKKEVPVHPSPDMTDKFLDAFKTPATPEDLTVPQLYDSEPPGWLVWGKSVPLYSLPHATKSTFQPWDPSSSSTIDTLREVALDSAWWEKLVSYYSEENHETTIIQDNVSCIKSICESSIFPSYIVFTYRIPVQILEDEPLEVFKPHVEKLIADKDQNKQRAAAELLAAHWPMNKQKDLWKWFIPFIPTILKKNIKSDTLSIWTSFLEYIFYRKDPRRVQPLVDYLVSSFRTMDYNPEMSFDVVKVISLWRAFYEELGRKFVPWTDETVERSWTQISNEHDDVRAFIGEILAFSQNIKWQPRPSLQTPEVFVRECQVLPADHDIMGLRGTYHKDRVAELVERFKVWRQQRVPGVRAFQSTYDRVGITVCKWLYQSIHDLHAVSTFDYILPLMPEIFRFTEVNDNKELAIRANSLLVRMCGVSPPVPLINPILGAIFDAIQSSPSWRVRLKALPLLQVFYFRQLPLISEVKIVEMLEVLCQRLDDEVVEVREMAASTLSGILRLSPRRSVLTLKDRFVRLAKNSRLVDRNHPNYNKAIRQRHAAILGICALVDSYPYTVEKWMPELLTSVLAEHTYDPIPISTTVRKCASNFKKTHQDTWHEDCKRFTDDQLIALSTLLTGSSYYA
ncbi:membrane protein [Coprinopsis cinerea okayama7|uniref:Membrane protein n=1 Tax=Coprinopsis cinerea (strain Okayama-7 / 130 / ATCC MYA-4618 / FGSC 9003) TaxID=240176 RepID=D6RJV0_COPC7|nr:membrane protein [Coprinopsis cinerea okayama7\|eukprot:XP_002912070.1 membrane protein [Coprinopsis cinerea okayama7\